MIIQIFAVHDAKAHAYMQPFFLHTKEMAQRSFSEAVMNTETQFHKHPLDYTLFYLGTYDDELGLVLSQAPPEMIITASQIKKENDNVKITE